MGSDKHQLEQLHQMGQQLHQMGQQVKLLVCDMDGTLLNNQKEVSDTTRAALRELKAQGRQYTICTGRIAPMAMYYMNTLAIEAPVITANGAVIWDPVNQTPLHAVAMAAEEVQVLLDFCQALGLDYSALTMNKSYFSRNSRRKARFDQYNEIARRNGRPLMELAYFDRDHACVADQKVFKILIYELIKGQLKAAEEFLKLLDQTGYTSSEPGLLDIAHRKVNKGYGVRKAAELAGLKKEEICAIGDYLNDIPMLKEAGFPVAMGNGCPEIMEYACYVTGTNEEDGVAQLLHRYIL